LRYTKPHLTYEQQLSKLKRRGVACGDDGQALALLRTAGYYRISAYVYPFRQLLPATEQTGVRYRSDAIRPGTTLQHIRDLWAFDRDLRLLCLDASETIEVGVRTRIAYVLGRRSTFGHVEERALDRMQCGRTRKEEPDGPTEFQRWISRYRQLLGGAKHEDYVRHHLATYPDDDLPIWVAVELLDFGAVARLLSLMRVEDQNEVAKGVNVSSGKRLHSMLRSLAYVRNLAAHHSRTWNRVLTVTLGKMHASEVGPDLAHLAGRPIEPKIYGALAVMAYLVRNLDAQSDWSRKVRKHVGRNFPDVPDLNPEADMGFPACWAELPLWRNGPRRKGLATPTRC